MRFSLCALLVAAADPEGLPLVYISTGVVTVAIPGITGAVRTQLVVPSLSGASHRVMGLDEAIAWISLIKQKLHDYSRALGSPLEAPSRNRGKLRTAFVSGKALDVAQYISVCDASEDWVYEDVGYLVACEAFCHFMADLWEGKGPKRMDPVLQDLAFRQDVTYEVKTGGLEATLKSVEPPLGTLQTDHLDITDEARRNLYMFLGFRLTRGSDRESPITTDESESESESDY